MQALHGLPDWFVATIFVGTFLITLFAAAWRNTKRQIMRTLAKRPNPTRAEFVSMMASSVSMEASEFLWDSAIPCLELNAPLLSPHPDDDLVQDLPIDDEDWSMEWPVLWAEQQGFHESNLPAWPEGWPATIRNYGRWLDMAPASPVIDAGYSG